MDCNGIIFSQNISESLRLTLGELEYDRLFVLTDDNSSRCCLNRLGDIDAQLIEIPSGDRNKCLDSLSLVWKQLMEGGATRHSLLINLGGGMVTDLGGFAASTFKRGIRFINVPTTLLSMVDASVGGKTGINFGGLKNEIGCFSQSSKVIIDTAFLQTLDRENLTSGYAEMIKHALISDEREWNEVLDYNLFSPDYKSLQLLLEKSIKVKERIVEADPKELGPRKALNLGHTAGHAFESLSMKEGNPILHGYAVAYGLVCELYLSCKKLGFPHDVLLQTIRFIKDNYGVFTFNCKQYDILYNLMTHDKKNRGNQVNFTLLKAVGDIHTDQTASKEEVFEMLDFYRETMGC